MLGKLFKKSPQRLAQVPEGCRVYAVGDIHGRVDLLDRLLRLIASDMEDAADKQVNLVFLGDYVDRGLHSREVIDRLTALKAQTTGLRFLMGNHEQAMLQFLDDSSIGHVWLEYGGLETLQSYGVTRIKSANDVYQFERGRLELREAIPDDHLEFLNTLEIHATIGDYFFVHAGIRPGVPLEDQSEEDMLWIRDEFLSSDRQSEKVIVHGHTPTDQPSDKPWRIGVDTGAYLTGVLSAVVLEGSERYFISTEN